MTISKGKVELVLAREKKTITEICRESGYSRTRFYSAMNGKNVTPKVVGKIAGILGVDVTEIIEMEN